MVESWLPVQGFPNYEVSDWGRVRNVRTQRLRATSLNAQGIVKVTIGRGSTNYTRSVAVLVAEAFIEPPRRDSFNSVIQLDGDRTNCRAENLMRRPRWFAIMYHRQFRPESYRKYTRDWGVWVRGTGEYFNNVFEPSVKYGLLFKDVFHSAGNMGEYPVFPTSLRFVADVGIIPREKRSL